ncbi:MAG: TraB/GumN family protein [Myxococcota bacterium]|jgi:pheromone shutdown-related protein TraB|nr:TraB/GumN family protein [Myxococcota bacterium]
MHEDITRIDLDGREILLVGTAHISQESVEVVRSIIEQEQPDVVCVELDEGRFKALREQQRWEDLDLRQIIRNKQLTFLMARLALMGFQKQMGSYTGVKPGAEMAAAIEIAEAQGCEVALIDRDVSATLLRAWRKTPWYKRAMLAFSLLFGVFEKTEVNEEELAKLRQEANITSMLDELGEAMPEVKSVLVDERDTYMAGEIQRTDGEKIVVVIGAAHGPGIQRKLHTPITEEVKTEISHVPPASRVAKVLPWILPLIVIGMFIYGFTRGDMSVIKEAALAWVLANGVLSALGALIALGHPLTILTAFIAAPITSLNPTVGAGMVAALAQAYFAPPKVRDMENVGDDIVTMKGVWQNRLTRVFLVFIGSSIGSSIGTFVALPFLRKLIG